jgi:hypothetical protein
MNTRDAAAIRDLARTIQTTHDADVALRASRAMLSIVQRPDTAAVTVEQMQTALRVLARMVRDEYPPAYSLSRIASIWGHASDEEAAALEAWEATEPVSL